MGEVQKLHHGVIISRRQFPRFVETYNFLVDFVNNLKGDADIPNDHGHISVDRTVEDHPVIRISSFKGIGGGGGGGTGYPRRYEIGIERRLLTFDNCYYRIGGQTFEGGSNSITVNHGGDTIVALVIDITGTEPTDSLEAFDSFEDLQQLEKNRDKFVIPLYTVTDNADDEEEDEDESSTASASSDGDDPPTAPLSVKLDWRGGPDAAMTEF